MIATILPSSPTFHAVGYNEHKVAKGVASLLEIKNFGAIDKLGYSGPDELREYLIEYSSRNSRIKQPQFHLAISCKGHEYTEAQLVEFAHQYLDEMGYGDQEQPLLIYAHRDTDNTHIHIVTSRVNPQGKKINDSNERRRSQKVIDKILNTDLKKQAEKDIRSALLFDFRNMNQFKAVMEAMNYEAYQKDGTVCIKKGGMVQATIDVAKIEEIAEINKKNYKPDVARYAQLRAIFRKYRDANTSRLGLEKDLKKLFGISLVCFGKKDSPYGYFAIDFQNKKVIEGAKILGIKDLLTFKTKEEQFAAIEDLIDKTFSIDPFITTKDLNSRLKRLGAFVRKGEVVFGINKAPLSQTYQALLKRNNKIQFINKFNPQNDSERNLLCHLFNFSHPGLLKLSINPQGKYICNDTELIRILGLSDKNQRMTEFLNGGYRIIRFDQRTFAYNSQRNSVTDLESAGYTPEQYADLENHFYPSKSGFLSKSNENKENYSVGKKPTLPRGSSERVGPSANREWEVGEKGYNPDDMDRKNGMSY